MQRPSKFTDNQFEAEDQQQGAVSRAVESPKLWRVAAVVLSICVAVLVVANLVNFGIIGGSDGEASASEDADSQAAGGTTGTGDEPSGPASGELDISELVAKGEESGGPWIAARNEPFRFKLEGVVSTEKEKQSVEAVAQGIYGSIGDVNIEVDPAVAEAQWAGNPAGGVEQLLFVAAYRTIEAEILVTNSEVDATGVAPAGTFLNEVWAESLGNAASADPAFSALEINTSFTTAELRTSTLKAEFDNGELVLSGELPDQELIDAIVKDASILFGNDAVVNEFVVAEDTFAVVPTRNLHVVLASFKPFRTFEFTIENETFTGRVIYGIDFAPGSSELDEVTKDSLDAVLRFLNFAKVPVSVIGYTDSDGSEASNAELSSERAKAVKDYWVEQGLIGPERVITTGRGSESPVGDNSTAEGREDNRRVELVFEQGAAAQSDN